MSAPRRIPYVAPAEGSSAIADAIRLRRGARGLTPLDQTLLNAPEIAVSPADTCGTRGTASREGHGR